LVKIKAVLNLVYLNLNPIGSILGIGLVQLKTVFDRIWNQRKRGNELRKFSLAFLGLNYPNKCTYIEINYQPMNETVVKIQVSSSSSSSFSLLTMRVGSADSMNDRAKYSIPTINRHLLYIY